MIIDGTHSLNKPDLGLTQIQGVGASVLYSNELKAKYGSQPPVHILPDQIGIFFKSDGGWLEDYPYNYLDIEHFGHDIAKIPHFLKVIDLWRKAYPNKTVGFYGEMPHRDYWRAKYGESGKETYDAWQLENEAMFPVADVVDYIYPSLYTFYNDVEGWKKYAIHNLMESKQYRKPVIPFLWPYYHNSNTALVGQYIGDDYLRSELELVLTYCDDVIIWDWRNVAWEDSDNAKWWAVVQEFL